jgi:hypothetical protein
VSLPLQFLPYAITVAGKRSESREVRRASVELAAWLEHAPQRPETLEARA